MSKNFKWKARREPQPRGKCFKFLEATIAFEGMGRSMRLRRLRKTHLENIIPRDHKIEIPRTPRHEITFVGFVTAPKYSCDSTINCKMTSYEALTSSDVLISHSDSRLDNFIRLLLNGPLESH